MKARYSYKETLESSDKIGWRVEDVIGGDKRLDFGRPFLPESFARVESMDFLTKDEKLLLNQIRGYGYLYTFGLVEEFAVLIKGGPSPTVAYAMRTQSVVVQNRICWVRRTSGSRSRAAALGIVLRVVERASVSAARFF